jgi:hypothetical protein
MTAARRKPRNGTKQQIPQYRSIMRAKDIDEVVDRLGSVIDESIATSDRVGLFAALYRQVTMAVRDGIESGDFDDGDRMNRFDTLFANRYFEALELRRAGEQPTKSWAVAFDACAEDRLIILQHVLLGVNAHINLDLGAAAAAVGSASDLPSLKPDFDRINDILSSVLLSIQDSIDRSSPLMGILDEVGGRTDEQLITYNVREARAEAWNHAVVLSGQDQALDERTMDVLDRKVAFIAKVIRDPGPLLRAALEVVRFTETRDVADVIEDLASVAPAPVP